MKTHPLLFLSLPYVCEQQKNDSRCSEKDLRLQSEVKYLRISRGNH